MTDGIDMQRIGSQQIYPDAKTQVVAVIGSPIEHSLSPTIHNAAFQQLDMNWVYVAFPVLPDKLLEATNALKAFDLRGFSVTMPHKTAIVPYLDEVASDASVLNAVNCVVHKDGKTYGYNTDGNGLLLSLSKTKNFTPNDKKCVVIGAGGAARSIVLALTEAGASEIILVNRTKKNAEQLISLTNGKGCLGDKNDSNVFCDADLVIHATPLGMDLGEKNNQENPEVLPFPLASLPSKAHVVDLVYKPLVTPLVRACIDEGISVENGVGMLIGQAALAFTLWTGIEAPYEQMSDSVFAK